MAEIIPLGRWVDASVHYLLDHDASAFDTVGRAIEAFASAVEHGLQAVPMWLMMAIIVGLGLWRVGIRFAIFSLASLLLIYTTGFWDQTVITLALTISSTLISLVLGVPLGIWAAKNSRVQMVVRPVLDLMQTMPAFVYLIPAAMLFGLGRVPGILSTVIFAMPPAVRLTSLGIRQVNREIVEAGLAFGCTPWQLLYKVQFPNALPSIMAGVNQTIMMALSMVIIASMVGAGGLGNDVLASIQRLDIGLGFESGLAVVLLAINLDRITESFGRMPGSAPAPWFAGLRGLFKGGRAKVAGATKTAQT
jgi:glycine betaine/proline transport system permease protein